MIRSAMAKIGDRTPRNSLRQARGLLDQGLLFAARDLITPLATSSRPIAEAMHLLATIHLRMGHRNDAIALLQRALCTQPTNLRTIALLGTALYYEGHADEALQICDRGLKLDPLNLELLQQRAVILNQKHEPEAAWKMLEPLAHRRDAAELKPITVRVLAALGRLDDAIAIGMGVVNDPSVPADVQRNIWFCLAEIFDKQGQYDSAFEASEAAHRMSTRGFHVDTFVRSVDNLIQTFSPRDLDVLARASNQSTVPVFIVGMPRSGTTLVEQIVASHRAVYGAGEVRDIDALAKSMTAMAHSIHTYPACLHDVTPGLADEIASRYLDHLTQIGAQASRVTNKMLELYFHIGLIWMLFPKSRIVHVLRDPFDTCISCFTRPLNQDRLAYAACLGNLGTVYRQHERLMNHWKSVLDLPILTVHYEQLVAEPEPVSRQIIEFLGLPWDERCLRYYESKRTVMTLSYDQVNKPIYDSSIGRWRNYEKYLDPLKRALQA